MSDMAATMALGVDDWATALVLRNDHEGALEIYQAMPAQDRAALLGMWLRREDTHKFLQCSLHPPLLLALLDDTGDPAFAAITWPAWIIGGAVAHQRLDLVPRLVARMGEGYPSSRRLAALVLSLATEQPAPKTVDYEQTVAAVVALGPNLAGFLETAEAMSTIKATTPLALLKCLDAKLQPGDALKWKTQILDNMTRQFAIAPSKSASERANALGVIDWAYTTGPQCLPDQISSYLFTALDYKPREASRFIDWAIKRLVQQPSPQDADRNVWHELACSCMYDNEHLIDGSMNTNAAFNRRLPVLMQHDILAPATATSSRLVGLYPGTPIDEQLVASKLGSSRGLEAVMARARAAAMHAQTPDATAAVRRSPRM